MDISGLVSYDIGPRTVSSAASSKGMMMPHLDLNLSSYSHNGMDSFVAYPSEGYHYGQMPSGTYQQMMPGYAQYPQPTQHHQYNTSQDQSQNSGLPHVREALDRLRPNVQSPVVKHEENSNFRLLPMQYENTETISPVDSKMSGCTASSTDSSFITDVDTLMKAIQAKSQPIPQRRLPLPSQPARAVIAQAPAYVNNYPQAHEAISPIEAQHSALKSSKSRKRYTCTIPGCSKSFFQKTHLEIHTRAHTGVKPFLCKESDCGQRFSQLGNLKTHERRHTGERPYCCEQCGKRFAQRGNVRAHRIVHEQSKPFNCKLENCQKQFTQLGNLKSHQNKFHAETLKNLTQRFATIREGDAVSIADKELWEYFATLYKNSNKGIKGRGKDRKISSGGNGLGAGAHEARRISENRLRSHHGQGGADGGSLSGGSHDGSLSPQSSTSPPLSTDGNEVFRSHHQARHHNQHSNGQQHHAHHHGLPSTYSSAPAARNAAREGSIDSGRSENGQSRHGAYDFNAIEEGEVEVELAFADRKMF